VHIVPGDLVGAHTFFDNGLLFLFINIPLNNVLTDILKHCIRHLQHDCVFTHNNEQVKYSKLRYHFEKAVKKAGIEDFTIHDIRHTCITNWRKQGHDYFKIMKASGHRKMNVFKRYNTVD